MFVYIIMKSSPVRCKVLSSLLIIAAIIPGILCFPTGAPARACGSLTPVHPGTNAQTSVSPYRIELSRFSHIGENIGNGRYKSGTTIDVTISSSSGQSLAGIILQARSVLSSSADIVGTWTILSNQDRFQQMLCQNERDTITHRDSIDDKSTRTFRWTAPSEDPANHGNVVFRATVAQSFNIYWTGIQSAAVIADFALGDLCTPNPCFNSGVCFLLGTGSAYTCVCSDLYQGTHCEIATDTCSPNPCLNGGVCFNPGPGATVEFFCQCQDGFTGTTCQTPTLTTQAPLEDSCNPNPCLNDGVCFNLGSGDGAGYLCQCPSGFTGTTCQTATTSIDYCDPNPCLNNGDCFNLADGTDDHADFLCQCAEGFTGTTCEIQTTTIQPIDACSSSPCLNSGTCVSGPDAVSYTCTCPVGFTGVTCQTSLTTDLPCSSDPCHNGGSCLNGADTFICQCVAGFIGNTCQTAMDICQSSPCTNGGTCFQLADDPNAYLCRCPAGFTGANCETAIDVCESAPCINGGTCFQQTVDPSAYSCRCPVGFTGANCETTFEACESLPCQNGGSCVRGSGGAGTYFCQCAAGYTGVNCQIPMIPTEDLCTPSPCANGAPCIVANQGRNYFCICLQGFVGNHCEISTPSSMPCDPSPCVNDGTCFLATDTTYGCICPLGFSGNNCQTPSSQACDTSPCGLGICYAGAADTYVCVCPDGRTDTSCETIDACTPNPCMNSGTCFLGDQSVPYFCLCQEGFVGVNCEESTNDPCIIQPCLNQGTCVRNSDTAYTCVCRSGYLGTNCEFQTTQPCNSNPCFNGGVCTNVNSNRYVCTCPVTHTGTQCEIQVAQGDRCSLSPCLNQGTCFNSASGAGYVCVCPDGFVGANCETYIDSGCNSNPCLNGGTCYQGVGTSYICVCQATHEGTHCETAIANSCTINPCFNGGVCSLAAFNTNGFVCQCPPTYTGTNCQTRVTSQCSPNPCFYGGTCVTVTGGYNCVCQPAYTGTNCQTLVINSCTANPCINGGTCYPVQNVYTCVCPPTYTGTNCHIQVLLCTPNPCYNGGTCIATATDYNCVCRAEYTGSNCQTLDSSGLCVPNPCQFGGTCSLLPNGHRYTCTCPPGSFGTNCQFKVSTYPCDSQPCSNGGTCFNANSDTSYICRCLDPYTGPQCNQISDPCLTNPCINNGVCYSLDGGSGFLCQCTNGYEGERCELGGADDPCRTNPCVNGGTCFRGQGSGFLCNCPPSHTGTLCEEPIRGCALSPCLNFGTCYASSFEVNGYFCDCVPPFTGLNCELDPCNPTPCQNEATCYIADGFGDGFFCSCPATFTGDLCETRENVCDLTQPCFNGGTCYQAISNPDGYLCVCPDTHTGTNCGESVHICERASPCLNGGTCFRGSGSVANSYLCACLASYTGQDCETFVEVDPCMIGNTPRCQNGGTCFSFPPTPTIPSGFICQCRTFFYGTECDEYDPYCNPNPCYSGGTCIPSPSSTLGYICTCPVDYSGERCATYQPSTVCTSVPCQNGGDCVVTGINSYRCNCNNRYVGTHCEIQSSVCTNNPCRNGGTCTLAAFTVEGYICTCPVGYTGTNCAQYVDPCDLEPCLNNGFCLNNQPEPTYRCFCSQGYEGDHCELLSNPCDASPCGPGTCWQGAEPLSYLCLCPEEWTGTNCDQVADPCAKMPCMNNGTCYRTELSYDFICICMPGVTGDLCEIYPPCLPNPCMNGDCVPSINNTMGDHGMMKRPGMNCTMWGMNHMEMGMMNMSGVGMNCTAWGMKNGTSWGMNDTSWGMNDTSWGMMGGGCRGMNDSYLGMNCTSWGLSESGMGLNGTSWGMNCTHRNMHDMDRWGMNETKWGMNGTRWGMNGTDRGMNGTCLGMNGTHWGMNDTNWGMMGSDWGINCTSWNETYMDMMMGMNITSWGMNCTRWGMNDTGQHMKEYDDDEAFMCLCDEGYEGMLCDNFTGPVGSPCDESPCGPGTCMNIGDDEYVCLCPALYLGDNCETTIDKDTCRPENRITEDGMTDCMKAIKTIMADPSAFWFGTNYTERCPIPAFTVECLNPDPRPGSMAQRLFGNSSSIDEMLTSYLDVVIHEKPGTYQGCGNTFVSSVEADHVLDPVNPPLITPYQSSKGFSVSIEGQLDPDAQYTLIIQDAGFLFLHGLFINIPGDDLDIADGEAILDYLGPLYIREDPPNPYVFMLFQQEENNMVVSISARGGFQAGNFANDMNLIGPIAVNWLMSTTDAYAAGYHQHSNGYNICPIIVQQAERELDLYHIPNDVQFTTSVNIEYFSPAMDFSACCNDYSFQDTNYTLNPIGDMEVSPFDNRMQPNVNFVKMSFSPSPLDFEGELLTLLMIDPDIDTNDAVGTKERPLAHWLTMNIPNGMVEAGDTVLPYRSSMPPAGTGHRYQFLLYKQNGALNVNPKDYAPDCQVPHIANRCLFEIERFVSENSLEFLGATWYTSYSDAYLAYGRLQQGGEPNEVCQFIEGFQDPCPTDKDTCRPENRITEDGMTDCMKAIKTIMADPSAFWFGTNYTERCPIPAFTVECLNPDPRPGSMAQRLFGNSSSIDEMLTSYLDVIIHEKPGTYQGCGNTFVSSVEADHVLDPVNPPLIKPYQSSKGFSVFIEGQLDPDAQYTLIIQDAGFLFLHGLFINIPGDDLDIADGEVILDYLGPLFIREDPPNPYVFMLFQQEENNMVVSISARGGFQAGNFANDMNLIGPIAVNWLMSTTDAYAAGYHQHSNGYNICPIIVQQAERELDLYHIPNDVQFTTSVNIEYFSPAMDFSACCNDYSFQDTNYTLNPIGDMEISPFDNRMQPNVNFVKMSFSPSPLDFEGELLTLLMIDPDIDTNDAVGTKERPLAHWLIMNIPNGMLEAGDTVLPYRSSMPPAGTGHRYQFLLYKQTGTLNVNPKDYAPDCQVPHIANRCLFEIERFVRENSLEFLGATWYTSYSDAYLAYGRLQQGGEPNEVCQFIEGFQDPCPTGTPPTVITTTSPLPTDPCDAFPCIRGTCVTDELEDMGYFCVCPPRYEGSRCENLIVIDYCISMPCQNGGTCRLQSSTDSYMCECSGGFIGIHCDQESPATNPCDATPCLQGGTCVPVMTADQGYECTCPGGFTGHNCERFIDVCLPNPCINGNCLRSQDRSDFLCFCVEGYTGRLCDIPAAPNPCESQPCIRGTCIETDTSYRCLCPQPYTGPRCEMEQDPCVSQPCVRGTCFSLAAGQFQCICPIGYIGVRCEDINQVDPCLPMPCQYGGTCIAQMFGGYICECLGGYSGPNCETRGDTCSSSSECLNGGICVMSGQFKMCACGAGFTGRFCEVSLEPCSSAPCLNGGVCVVADGNEYVCVCQNGYTGVNCESSICSSEWFACYNGNCVSRNALCNGIDECGDLSDEMNLECNTPTIPPPTTPSVMPCDASPYPCINGGLCVPFSNDAGYLCACPSGYSGEHCEQSIICDEDSFRCTNGYCVSSNALCNGFDECGDMSDEMDPSCGEPTMTPPPPPPPTTLPPITQPVDPCTTINPCVNGRCMSLSPAVVYCLCDPGWTSALCDEADPTAEPCTSNPCINGVCLPSEDRTSYSCVCEPGWVGPLCQRDFDECSSNPCRNSATCIDGINQFTCICPPDYTGLLCEQNIDACRSNPCQNGALCSDQLNGYQCSCQTGYEGDNCEININECFSNPCLNGGTCRDMVNRYECQCPIGWSGNTCQTLVGCNVDYEIPDCGSVQVESPNYPNTYRNLESCQWLLSTEAMTPIRITIEDFDTEEEYDKILIGNGANPSNSASQIAGPLSGSMDGLERTVFTSNGDRMWITFVTDNNKVKKGFSIKVEDAGCVVIPPCNVSNPCINGGQCKNRDNYNYYCQCPARYEGEHCETERLTVCDSNPCRNGGTCFVANFNEAFLCQCPEMYSGNTCETELFVCPSDYCLNGGTCSVNGNSLQCSCPDGYGGSRCESSISPTMCPSDYCQNGGLCIVLEQSGQRFCSCPSGYGGEKCEISPCPADFCSNGGTCYQPDLAEEEYACDCPANFRGDKCEEELTNCDQNPCKNGATCDDTGGIFTCLCPAGYEGIICENTPCDSITCENGATCELDGSTALCVCVDGYYGNRCQRDRNECASEPCQNGGMCEDMINSFICDCVDQFTGDICSINKSECANRMMCQNGGVCERASDGMTGMCVCATGWFGTNCENNIDDCQPNPCQNGGNCVDLVEGYRCACQNGYLGKNCEDGKNAVDAGKQQTQELALEPWWIALICLIGFLFIIFIVVVLCTMNRSTYDEKSQLVNA
ncbi:uncharacterized protein [Amphiura filiformis]|uniref:uncharacterized protein n=1 Tax=Amphiura filiformis TaxID=82378 RepID=UPI003B20D32E